MKQITGTITFTHSERIDIRNLISYRLYKIEEYLHQHQSQHPTTLQRMYASEHDALTKLRDALDTGKDVVLNIGPDRLPGTIPDALKDRALAHLYANHDKTIVGAYVYVFTKSGGTWDYFNRHDWTLHTDLLDEDYTYYKDCMYPTKQEYDDIDNLCTTQHPPSST